MVLPVAFAWYGAGGDAAAAQTRLDETTTVLVVYSQARDSALLRLRDRSVVTLTDASGCEFNRIGGVVLMPGGTIVVANTGNSELCFFRETGALLRRIGRAGSGPGEYRDITHVHRLPPDSLLVYDGLLRRITILDPAGTRVRTFNVAPPREGLGSVAAAGVLRDGSIILAFSEVISTTPRAAPAYFTARVFRYDRTGQLSGEIGRFPMSEHFVQAVPRQFGGVSYYDLAFGRRLSVATVPNGFVAGDGTDWVVREFALDGTLSRMHSIKGTRRAVGERDHADYRAQAFARARPERRALVDRMVEEMPYPAAYPAFRSLLADEDGRLWLEVYPSYRPGPGLWYVADPTTTSVRRFETPAGLTIRAVSSSRACGVLRDEFDLESVHCYRLNDAR